jgi:hypothetical protein
MSLPGSIGSRSLVTTNALPIFKQIRRAWDLGLTEDEIAARLAVRYRLKKHAFYVTIVETLDAYIASNKQGANRMKSKYAKVPQGSVIAIHDEDGLVFAFAKTEAEADEMIKQAELDDEITDYIESAYDSIVDGVSATFNMTPQEAAKKVKQVVRYE